MAKLPFFVTLLTNTKWLVSVLIGVQLIYASVDRELRSNTDALRNIQREIGKAEAELNKLSKRENSVLKNISEIDNGLTITRESLNDLEKRERTLGNTIRGIEREIDALQKNIDNQKEAIASRIRNLYIHGKREEWELLFNLLKENEDPERKLYWVQRLLENDKIVVENYLASINKQKEKKRQLETRRKEMTVLHESKAKEQQKLENQLSYQNDLLTKVKKDKTTQEKAIEEFKQNQRALTALITALEKRRKAELAARKKAEEEQRRKAAQKGRVAIPKETPVAIGTKCTPLRGEIISAYGYYTDPILGIRREQKGTEIRGQKGESIKAAAEGTVVWIGNLPGHGPGVILDHKGTYFTAYGHLASRNVKVGDAVKSCQEIGTVGNVESINGYKLYFQVYKGTQTQDPMKWLKN
ncbi:MAG: peptidoglycan DD-metalloendopeptidase family protein [Fibromonadaceae bacterium]|jgi:septal ring factor EnvC (AmiA/AmiB activator)|nr:peptidoglycan DD-metalloendopeptidase family protein [Fibromonadaceae bacterium]